MEGDKDILKITEQKLIRYFLYVSLFMASFFMITDIIKRIILNNYFADPVYYIFYIYCFIHFLALWKIRWLYKIPFRILINTYLIVISLVIFLTAIISFPTFPIIFLYFIVFPLALKLVNSYKITVIWSVLLILLVIYIFGYFDWNYFQSWNLNGWKDTSYVYLIWLVYNYQHIVMTLVILWMLIYFALKFKEIKIQLRYEQQNLLSRQKQTSRQESKDNFDVLYEKIVDYLEKDKPFLDTNYKVEQLAKALNTNRTYISFALQKGNTNFYDVINKYRIEQVINDIKNGKHQKFTLKVLYNKAGFSQQTSFNRAFKKVTGKSPSEYIKSLEGVD